MIATMLPCPCEASAAAVMSTVSPGMNGRPATSRNTTPKTTQRPKCSTKCVTTIRGYLATRAAADHGEAAAARLHRIGADEGRSHLRDHNRRAPRRACSRDRRQACGGGFRDRRRAGRGSARFFPRRRLHGGRRDARRSVGRGRGRQGAQAVGGGDREAPLGPGAHRLPRAALRPCRARGARARAA